MLAGAAAMALAQQPTTSGAAGENSTAKSGKAHMHHAEADAKSKGSDEMFAKKAALGGMAEVELGKLAAEKATDPAVKQFAQRMVDDHSKANDQLKAVAQSANITLPTGMDPKDEALRDKLSGMSGAAFDRAYMRHMLEDHNKDVKEFQHEASAGKNDALKQFAAQTLPTLQEHQKMARETAAKAGASAHDGKSKKSSNATSGSTI